MEMMVETLKTISLTAELLKELKDYGIYPHIKSSGEVAFHVTDKRLFDALTDGCDINVRQRADADYPYELVAKNGQFEMFCLVPAAQQGGDVA